MQCPNPKCGSTRISYNRIPTHVIDRVKDITSAGATARIPLLSFGGMAVWGALNAINSLRCEWRCDACQATFDA
jgi:hypothetical protein